MKQWVATAISTLMVSLHCNAAGIFWIGVNSVWDDKDNWSLTSAGASCSCLPSILDDVNIQAGIGNDLVVIGNNTKTTVQSVRVFSGKHLEIGEVGGTYATLTIDGGTTGLLVQGKVTVFDNLVAINISTSIQVNLNATLILAENSTVHLENGVRNFGDITLKGSTINQSSLLIDHPSRWGINSSSGTISNAGLITIKNIVHPFDFSGIYNYDAGNFVNEALGIIVIDSVGIDDLGLGLGAGLDINSEFRNDGLIQITNTKNYGLRARAQDTLHNGGTISISSFKGLGIWSHGFGTLINTGTLEVFLNLDYFDQGIQNGNGAKLINATGALINIHDMGAFTNTIGLNNSAIFQNSGSVQIDNIGGQALLNVFANADFISDGQILITTYTESGLSTDSNFEIPLGGIIEIGQN